MGALLEIFGGGALPGYPNNQYTPILDRDSVQTYREETDLPVPANRDDVPTQERAHVSMHLQDKAERVATSTRCRVKAAYLLLLVVMKLTSVTSLTLPLSNTRTHWPLL